MGKFSKPKPLGLVTEVKECHGCKQPFPSEGDWYCPTCTDRNRKQSKRATQERGGKRKNRDKEGEYG